MPAVGRLVCGVESWPWASFRFVAPKRHRSTRSVPLSRLAMSVLSAQRVRQAADRLVVGPDWEDHDLVFAAQLGTPLEPRNVNRRFRTARSSAGLPWVRLNNNDHGVIVGLSCWDAGCRAVRWDSRRLTDLIASIAPTQHWELFTASAVNSRGQITGDGDHAGNSRGYLLTTAGRDGH